ncbi:MAG: sensor histidine kinase [Bacteroidales bacterium]|nr:sensor histidine kinase [Bacteroidales bacterium]MCF8343199.1 sensor histidine kinase [Bacteroidales bacterium]MCF8352126.1 sensor histidine kinase [Bacteroidales bacterium]MCF8377282.1 sensor histidine kinase [Bacteroidales bacterium]MCF8401096.1 sensor histidine kinase [Bacteroidales bacterium]
MRLFGTAFRKNEEYRKALEWYDQELEIRNLNQYDLDLASLNVEIGICYDYLSDYDKAIEHYLIGFKIARENDLSGETLSAANNLGVVYKNLDDFNRAKKYFKQAYQIAKETNNEIAEIVVSNNLGVCFKQLEVFDSALYYYEISLQMARKKDFKRDIAYALSNIAVIYGNMNELDKAIEYTRDALEIKKNINNRRGLASSYFVLGKYYAIQKKFSSSLDNFHKGLKIARDLGNLSFERDFYEFMYYTYDTIGMYDSSNFYLKKYFNLKDSIINDETKNKIAELETKYETAEKERQIEILEKDRLIQQERIERADITRNFLVIGIVLSVIMAFLIYLVHRNRVRTTKLIASKNLELREQKIREMEKARQIENMQSMIKGQEEERQRIARELHDEIQNQLVVVKTRLEKLKSSNVNNKDIEEAGKQIDLANEKTRRISHGMVPMVLQRFGLQGAIEQALNDANATKPELKINKQIIGLDQRLDPVVELNLYRIIQEVINNMLKHADAKETTLILSKKDYKINLSFEDDGIGFDPAGPAFQESMGLQNIRSRVEILNGTLQIDSKPKEGTNIEINIPINQNSQNHDQSFHSRRPPGGH